MSKKNPSDIWHEIEKDEADKSKVIRKAFVDKADDAREGMSADREKFGKGIPTFSPKLLPADRDK